MAAAVDFHGFAQPADGGLYVLREGSWYCVIFKKDAPDSHVSCKSHAWYLSEYLKGKLVPMALEDIIMQPNNAPPPPTGQPSDDRPGPPPPLGQARDPHRSAAILIGPPPPAAESPERSNQVLAHVSVKLHAKLDTMLAKLAAMEIKLEEMDWKMNALCHHILPAVPAEE